MGVYKKNNKWYCRGRINGERYHKYCDGATNKEEAKTMEETFRTTIRSRQNGVVLNDSKIPFSFMMDKLYENYEANENDIKTILPKIKYLTLYFKPDRDIRTIRPSDVERFKTYMAQNGKKNATINRYLAALRRGYNILINDDLIAYNPVNKVSKLIEDNKRNRYLSKKEWNKLKLSLSPRIYSIVVIALLTGFRLNNVLTLRWEQIDFELGFIEIKRMKNKGKKLIRLPLTENLFIELQKLSPKKEGYLFLNPDTNEPYKDIRKSFKAALKRAGITDFKFHDLRRTFATWLLEAGTNIRIIQHLLAHSDISTTEAYLSIDDEASKNALNRLNKFIV